ncbi:MAG: OsmC family protein [Pleurocapsa sp. MO_192.B19]|nr:OsmC family protein [Pleurocapsa sp. MO_192.B19]
MYPINISSTSGRYRQDITINDKFHLTADEPLDLGGDDAGATPIQLVLAGLGSCKAITLQMYAERKGWQLTHVDVDVTHQKIDRQYVISVGLHLEGNLTNEQKQRLLEFSAKCPVHKLLKSEAQIETFLAE